jgi:hypothetical protein
MIWAFVLASALALAAPGFSRAGEPITGGSAKPTAALGNRISAEHAVGLVTKVLLRHKSACHLRIRSIVVSSRIPRGWRVTTKLRIFGRRDTAHWNVVRKRVTAADPLAADIANDCP